MNNSKINDMDTSGGSVDLNNKAVLDAGLMFSVHEFSDKILDADVYFHCLSMKDSFFIWIGSKPANMASLSMAIPTPYVRGLNLLISRLLV